MSFETWMSKVDAALETACGLGSLDLPDWGYRDAFDDGMSPQTAAKKVLKAAAFF